MKILVSSLFFLFNIYLFAQTNYQQFLARVNSISRADAKTAVVDSFMNYARSQGIPLIEGDTATFLYRGGKVTINGNLFNLFTVDIYGDVNYYGDIALGLTKIPGTDLFVLRRYLEKDARLDYNYVLNGAVITLDPENHNVLPWGTIGEVNEIAMPGYEQPQEIIYNPDIPHGKVEEFYLQNNNTIPTNHKITVHLPSGYDTNSGERYPVAYFHDGSFYYYVGNVNNILDNLIYQEKIKPIIGVFVDYSQDNRTKEYVFETDQFIKFFNTTVVPYIDQKYKTIPDGENRAVIGLSFGGNISALIVNSVKDMYKNCGLHSGAIWPVDFLAARTIYEQSDWNIKYYLVWGTYEPKLMDVGVMVRDSLLAKGYTNFKWGQYPQGHSMGFWRGTTDIFLEYFFPGENVTSVNNEQYRNLNYQFQLNQNYPNPFNPETKINYSLTEQGFVKLVVYDLLGREIKTLVNSYKNPGNYSEPFNASNLSSGNYFYSLQFGGKFVTKKMSFIK